MERATAVPEPVTAALTVALWHDPATPAPPRLVAKLAERDVAILDVTNPFMALAALCRLQREAQQTSPPSRSGALVIVSPETLDEAAAVYETATRYAPGCRCWLYGPESAPQLRAVSTHDVAAWAQEPAAPPAPPAAVAPAPSPNTPPVQPEPAVKVRPAAIKAAVKASGPAGGRPVAPPPFWVGTPDYRTKTVGPPKLRLAGTYQVDPVPQRSDLESGEGGGSAGESGAGVANPSRSGPILTAEELQMLLGEDEAGESGQR